MQESMGNGVILLNNEPEYTGTGKYALDLFHATRDYSVLYNLVSRAKEANFYPKGISETGLSSKLFVFPSFWNSIAPEMIYRKTYKKLREHLKNKEILHYCNHSLKPVVQHTKTDVVTVHDLFVLGRPQSLSKTKNIVFGEYTRRFLQFENIIVPSEYVKNLLLERNCKSTITVIHNPISEVFMPLNNIDNLRLILGLPIDKILVLSIGSVSAQKNLSTLKKVVIKLGSNFRLVRVGPPLGLDGEIDFGRVSNERLNQIYNACDVLLNTSIYEGFGYTNIEAAATNTLVVASDIQVYRETMRDSAKYVHPMDYVGFAETIKLALEDKDRTLIKYQSLVKPFRFKYFSKKMKEYYSEIALLF